ncbi:hypothetical protein JZ751_003009 [Albula glossodonta]|uniref:Uncharacterized protein n=1 Tax=Albula glossodonta TaxID=121402 RepID=A0A8T2NG39_9TELE|nr:hypothetical protein JZ751_003009 [Albula glossodonta]
MGRRESVMRFVMTEGERGSMTATSPEPPLIRGQSFREIRTETSVSSSRWVNPIHVPQMKLSMTSVSSTKTRAWTVALLVERMKSTMCMTSPSGVAGTWLRTSIGPVRLQTKTCMVMIWTPLCKAADLSPTVNSAGLTMDLAGMAPCSLKRIPSVWINSWRRPSSTVDPKGHPPVDAQRIMTTTKSAERNNDLFFLFFFSILRVGYHSVVYLLSFNT